MTETKAGTNGIIFWVDAQEGARTSQWQDGMPRMFFMKPNTLPKSAYDELLTIFTAVNGAQPPVLSAEGVDVNMYEFKLGNQVVSNDLLNSFIAAARGADAKSELNRMRLERFDNMNISSITSTGKIHVVKIRIAYKQYVAPEDIKIEVHSMWGTGDRDYYYHAYRAMTPGNAYNGLKIWSYIPPAFGRPLSIGRISYRKLGTFGGTDDVEVIPARASRDIIENFIAGYKQVGPSEEQAQAGITSALETKAKAYPLLSDLDTQEVAPGTAPIFGGLGIINAPGQYPTTTVESQESKATAGLLEHDSKNPMRYMIYYPRDGRPTILVRYVQGSALGTRGRQYLYPDQSTPQEIEAFLRDFVPYNQTTRNWQDMYEKQHNIE